MFFLDLTPKVFILKDGYIVMDAENGLTLLEIHLQIKSLEVMKLKMINRRLPISKAVI